MLNIVKSVPTVLDVLVLDTTGKAATGITVTYRIFDAETDLQLTMGTMTELASGGFAVMINISTPGQYRIYYFTPVGYEDGEESFMIIDEPAKESTLQAESLKISKILGMVQENFRTFDHVYNSEGDLISSTIRTYPSASDCSANTNPIATYHVTASYTTGHKLTSYQVIEV